MRRPVPREGKKTEGFFVRLSDQEKRLLRDLAKADDVSPPALVRHLIREYGRIRREGQAKRAKGRG